MNLLSKNIAANFSLQAWVLISQIILVPVYVQILGIEAYGLVGFYASLQAIFFVLEMGMGVTINQELAKVNVTEIDRRYKIDLLKTLEWVYWGMAIFIFVVIVFIQSFFSEAWGSNASLSSEKIGNCIYLMGGLLVFRFPIGLYSGALNGIQKQFALNMATIVFEVIKFVLVLLVLFYVSKDVVAYFVVNIVIACCTVIMLRFMVWRYLDAKDYFGKFKRSVLFSRWRFSLGVAGIAVVAIVLTQADKMMLAKMVSLKEFGWYTLAFTIASIPSKIVGAVATAYYPLLVQENSRNDEVSVSKIYQQASQLIAVLLVPVCMVFWSASEQILKIWFQDQDLIRIIHPLVKVFIFGFMFNGLMTMPYYLQLAYHWTKLSLLKNIIALIILVPLLYLVIQKFGINGAVWIWLVLNFSYIIFEVPLMHRRVLPKLMKSWYLETIVKPILFCGGMSVVSIWLFQFMDLPVFVYVIFLGFLTLIQMVLLNRWLSERPLHVLGNIK
ncbi:MAG: oligosaccharide flippase family protein [Saprospiraceae bacterium]|nr:oligosaccharide flippase family protein [Candidatus Vicinibacter proximus]MBL7823736.1 oligosaccharide flippase family protein [Saprospiraceae bacterium]MCC6841819.1 oligosaccharide flippase family protein [Saprospiraceae bacterium]HRG32904.1 oligosaccharide flippase family protein [Saprospiraceae bacterium]